LKRRRVEGFKIPFSHSSALTDLSITGALEERDKQVNIHYQMLVIMRTKEH